MLRPRKWRFSARRLWKARLHLSVELTMLGVSYKCAEAAPEQNTLSALAPESARFLKWVALPYPQTDSSYIEAKVKSLKQDTIELEDLAPTSTHKRVAALAFYNCLCEPRQPTTAKLQRSPQSILSRLSSPDPTKRFEFASSEDTSQ